MLEIILLVVAGLLAVASYTDIKKREVPDWLNYGLIIFGVGVNLLLSVAFWTYTFIAYSILGLAVFFAVAYVMFYTGQWGGGDSKMLIGLGAVFGLPFFFSQPYINVNSFMISLWFNLLIVGVIYALLWSIYLALKNRAKFTKELRSGLRQKVMMRRGVLLISAVIFAGAIILEDALTKLLLVVSAMLLVLTVYLSVFSKAVERAGMLKLVKPEVLTEGDWIAKNIVVGKKTIAGPKDLGISKKQLAQLMKLYRQGKVKKVLMKVGIPFVPSFFAAFILTVVYGNVFAIILRII